MKNKIISAVMSIVLVFTFSGCTGSSEPEPVTPTETVTQSVTPEPEPSEPETTAPEIPEGDVDQLYVDVLRENYPLFNNVPDSVLVDFAESTCQAFDDGASLNDVLTVIQQNASNQSEAEAFAFAVGAAVPVYCPEHMDEIPGGVDNGQPA